MAWHSDANHDAVLPPRRRDVRVYEFDGESVLHDVHSGHIQLLNRTALTVLQRCDGRATVPLIAGELTREYDVDPETARDHVEQLVALFAGAGLLEEGA